MVTVLSDIRWRVTAESPQLNQPFVQGEDFSVIYIAIRYRSLETKFIVYAASLDSGRALHVRTLRALTDESLPLGPDKLDLTE